MIDPILSRHEAAATHPTGQRVVVFHSETQNSIVLNPTGSWLWNQLDEPQRQSAWVKAMCQEHPDQATETIEKDIQAYVAELVENQILVAKN